MRRSVVLVSVFALPLMLVLVLARAQSQHPALAAKADPDDPVSIHADVVATGIPRRCWSRNLLSSSRASRSVSP